MRGSERCIDSIAAVMLVAFVVFCSCLPARGSLAGISSNATKSLACDSFGDILFPTGKLIPVSPNTPDRRLIDPVSSVRPEHSQSINPLRVSAVEWQARTEAAALYRALYMYDMGSDFAAQCVMH